MYALPEHYTLLVVDDETDMHLITQMALKNMEYAGRALAIECVASGEAAVEFMQAHPETAVVLMDVVMESETAGLDACRRIREALGNDVTRILLRTGQPGVAPEKSVIDSYGIDGYLSKAEMTKIRLYTAIRTALKGYTELQTSRWLEHILNQLHLASAALFTSDSLPQTLQQILDILQTLLPNDLAILQLELNQEVEGQNEFVVFASATQAPEDCVEQVKEKLLNIQAAQAEQAFKRPQPMAGGTVFPLLFPSGLGQGWLYITQDIRQDQSLSKALELLSQQAVIALYTTLIRYQALLLERDALVASLEPSSA